MRRQIKKLQKHFSNRFQKTVELIQSKILKAEDCELFIQEEPSVTYILQMIKKQKSEEQKRAISREIIRRDKDLIDLNIESTEKEKAVLNDELSRLMFTEPATPEEIQHKASELNYLSSRIKACDLILQDLNKCKNTYFKKSVGRPKKEEEKTIFDIAKEVKDVDDSGLNLEEQILVNIRKLSPGKKKYILTYILQMLEAEALLKLR